MLEFASRFFGVRRNLRSAPPALWPQAPNGVRARQQEGGKRPEQDQQGLFWDLKTLVGNALSTVLVLAMVLGLRALVLVLGDG
jgi:hypothetical protein